MRLQKMRKTSEAAQTEVAEEGKRAVETTFKKAD